MSAGPSQLAETVRRFLTDRAQPAADEGAWPAALWAEAEVLGLPAVAVAEARGGAGLSRTEVAAVLFEAGRAAATLPLGECVLAEAALAAAGLPAAQGFVAPAFLRQDQGLALMKSPRGWSATGVLHDVPRGRHARQVVAIAGSGDGAGHTCLLPIGSQLTHGSNLAGEPRDSLRFDGVHLPRDAVGPGLAPDRAHALGAAITAVMMSGAMDAALGLCVGFARERVQFGRPIAAFQAVQQQMAVLVAQAESAAAAASAAFTGGGMLQIAMAKTRAGEAAGLVAAIAHQVHGAIGFTREHALQRLTRRLWSWRDEYGGEAAWARVVGRAAAAGAGSDLWARLTDPGSP